MVSEGENQRKLYIPLLQGVIIFIWTLAVKGLTSLTVYVSSSSEESIFNDFPNWAIHLIVISASLFIYNSVVRLLTLFDKRERDLYLEQRAQEFKFASEVLSVIKSKDFILENAVAIPLFALSGAFGAFPEAGSLILGDGVRGTMLCGIVSALIMAPLFFVIGIFTRYEVRRYWIVLDRNQETYKTESPFGFIMKALLISLCYPIVYPGIPLLLFIIFNIFSILFAMFDALNIIGIAVVILLLALIIYVIPLIKAMVKRRNFIKQLRKICMDNGFQLSEITRPFRSFFAPGIGQNFSITKDGKEYRCAFVSTLHRSTWLYFTSDTDAYFRHRIGTKNHHFTVNHNIEYGIRGEGEKCIIISPIPKHIFAESNGASREILPGDRIWGYTVYNMSGFINAIDRDCLSRSNIPIDK